MNYFKNKNRVILSLSQRELEEGSLNLQKDLIHILPVHADTCIHMDWRASSTIAMPVLQILLSFSKESRKAGAKIILKCRPDSSHQLEQARLQTFFDQIETGA